MISLGRVYCSSHIYFVNPSFTLFFTGTVTTIPSTLTSTKQSWTSQNFRKVFVKSVKKLQNNFSRYFLQTLEDCFSCSSGLIWYCEYELGFVGNLIPSKETTNLWYSKVGFMLDFQHSPLIVFCCDQYYYYHYYFSSFAPDHHSLDHWTAALASSVCLSFILHTRCKYSLIMKELMSWSRWPESSNRDTSPIR